MKPAPDFENDSSLTDKQKKRRRYYYSHREESIYKTGVWQKHNRPLCRENVRRFKNRHREEVRRKGREERKIWRSNNREKAKMQDKEQYHKHRKKNKLAMLSVKAEVMAAYGGYCVCCGETTVEFLSLDHIYNDGKQERAGSKTASGSTFYRTLKKLGFPKGRLQVMCYNCNLAKGYYGVCPHQVEASRFIGKQIDIPIISRPRVKQVVQ